MKLPRGPGCLAAGFLMASLGACGDASTPSGAARTMPEDDGPVAIAHDVELTVEPQLTVRGHIGLVGSGADNVPLQVDATTGKPVYSIVQSVNVAIGEDYPTEFEVEFADYVLDIQDQVNSLSEVLSVSTDHTAAEIAKAERRSLRLKLKQTAEASFDAMIVFAGHNDPNRDESQPEVLAAEPDFFIELLLTFHLSEPTRTLFSFGPSCDGDAPRAVTAQTALEMWTLLDQTPQGAWLNASGAYPNLLTVSAPSESELSFSDETSSFTIDGPSPSVVRFRAATGDRVDVQVLGLDAVTRMELAVIKDYGHGAPEVKENSSVNLIFPESTFYLPSVRQLFAGSDGTRFCAHEPVALTLEVAPGSSCRVATEVPSSISHPGPVLQPSGTGTCRFTARAPALGPDISQSFAFEIVD